MFVPHPVRLVRPFAGVVSGALALAVSFTFAAPSAAQVYTPAADPSNTYEYWSDEIPAHLSAVEGQVALERDGRLERAEPNIVLLAGDRLRTERGRVEILFADGSAVAVDEFTSLGLLDASLMRLDAGRVRVTIARATGAVEYRIDSAAGSALLRTPGEFKVALRDADTAWPEVDLTVIRGTAELANAHGRTLVRAGTHAAARPDAAPSLPYPASVAAVDAFDRWADEQRDYRLGYDSARYLPTELHYTSGVFDRYGAWSYEPTYSTYVWYPRVSSGWSPYSVGRWSFVGRFGWLWVGVDRWSWPTHHYGRWGVSGGRWHWIPDRRWGPAWVSWAGTPGYVGWCPLGYNNRPVYSITTINVNYNSPSYGWTVLPRTSFGHNVQVADHRVPSGRAVPREWAGFAEQPGAPAPTMRTAAAQPLRSPSAARTAVTRGSAQAPGAVAQTRGGTAQTRSAISPGVTSRAPSATSRSAAPPRDTSALIRQAGAPTSGAVRRTTPSTAPTIRGAAPPASSSDPATTSATRRAAPRGTTPTITYGGSTSPSTRGGTVRSASPTPPSNTRATSPGARRAAPPSRTVAPPRSTSRSAGPTSRSTGPTSRTTAPPSRSSGASRPSAPPAGSARSVPRTRGGSTASPPSTPPASSSSSGRASSRGGGGGTTTGRTASRRGGGGGGGGG